MILIPRKWIEYIQISPKNLRLGAILISIYEILIAHVIMFVMLLGLINAEKAQKLLLEDIDDQKEMEDYYYYPAMNNRGETLDIIRLNSATKLASSTVYKLTIGTVIATIYLLVCLGLFAGVIKNRAHFIVPWMIFDVIISLVINSILLIVGTNMLYTRFAISNWLYWSFCAVYTIMNLCTWSVVFQYHSILRQMTKLREEAIIPAPIVTPYPYYHENTIESHNGLKHTTLLGNIDHSNYVA
ncbi:hypothetical protein PVAND_001563 [Polypedilum vanderplanki]|uniref:Uncharacterized protein n=1 Tax=Polypedilum vanderplanki TaxID=319348 RepID=A0A9J6BNL4_POLVA|nr:hypothetical protein PVAND_001563 [Polypedilum vanderplanki]